MGYQEREVLHYTLNDQGNVLATRAHGVTTAQHLQELYDGQEVLILDFAGVDATSMTFLSQLLGAVSDIMKTRQRGGPLIMVMNVGGDVLIELQGVLERREATIAKLGPDGVELIAGAPHLQETLREAQAFSPHFTTTELAERLAIELSTLNERLKPLIQAGALARERDPNARQGRKYLYRAPDLAALPRGTT